jgi:hypothetical protein
VCEAWVSRAEGEDTIYKRYSSLAAMGLRCGAAVAMTPKQEKFCQAIMKGKNPSAAYRIAFDAKKMQANSIASNANRLMNRADIRLRIKEICEPVIQRIRTTQEEWLERAERFDRADVRKMFDQFGNPLEIKDLGPNEAAMIAGFEFLEQYETVNDSETGNKKAVAVGVLKKVKLGLPFLEGHKYLGKVLGYYVEKQKIEGVLTLEALILAAMGQAPHADSPRTHRPKHTLEG